jgi:hypothetical protein
MQYYIINDTAAVNLNMECKSYCTLQSTFTQKINTLVMQRVQQETPPSNYSKLIDFL